jgi:hypothetical protein
MTTLSKKLLEYDHVSFKKLNSFSVIKLLKITYNLLRHVPFLVLAEAPDLRSNEKHSMRDDNNSTANTKPLIS